MSVVLKPPGLCLLLQQPQGMDAGVLRRKEARDSAAACPSLPARLLFPSLRSSETGHSSHHLVEVSEPSPEIQDFFLVIKCAPSNCEEEALWFQFGVGWFQGEGPTPASPGWATVLGFPGGF